MWVLFIAVFLMNSIRYELTMCASVSCPWQDAYSTEIVQLPSVECNTVQNNKYKKLS